MRAINRIEIFVEEETGNKFMMDARLGYIHSCPTNLGTGMRASIHINLPGWAKEGFSELQNRCTELSLQCREISDVSGSEYEKAPAVCKPYIADPTVWTCTAARALPEQNIVSMRWSLVKSPRLRCKRTRSA